MRGQGLRGARAAQGQSLQLRDKTDAGVGILRNTTLHFAFPDSNLSSHTSHTHSRAAAVSRTHTLCLSHINSISLSTQCYRNAPDKCSLELSLQWCLCDRQPLRQRAAAAQSLLQRQMGWRHIPLLLFLRETRGRRLWRWADLYTDLTEVSHAHPYCDYLIYYYNFLFLNVI